MPIVFLEQRKKSIYLAVIFIAVVLLTWFVIQKGILTKRPVSGGEEVLQRYIEIDFSVLQSSQLEKLQLPEQVPALEGEAGRENPFIAY